MTKLLDPAVQNVRVENNARRDDPDHIPLHKSFGFRWILHLFADGDPEAPFNETGHITLGRMVGDTAHGNGLFVFFVSGGQGDVEYARGDLSVFKKHLIEIAHAVKEDGIGVLLLDRKILLNHRGGFNHGSRIRRACPELGRLGFLGGRFFFLKRQAFEGFYFLLQLGDLLNMILGHILCLEPFTQPVKIGEKKTRQERNPESRLRAEWAGFDPTTPRGLG